MTLLDYVVLTIVVVSVAYGALRGIVRSAVSLAAVISGLFFAAYWYEYPAVLYRPFGASPQAAHLLGFITLFVAALVGGVFLSRVLRGGLKRLRIGWTDHVFGAVFGLIRAWLICSAIYLALTAFPVRLDAVEQARLAPVLLEGTRAIAYLTSREFKDQFYGGYEIVQRFWNKINAK
ncbi:MAG: hypothetical protein DMF61_23470 [Blastocatellia bacterium AA13]|nr:MAG: hypothetical protein DMF61_23470 [Blastocatellia bacterium AA13]